MSEHVLPKSVTATGVVIDRLGAGTVIVVTTQNSRYRLVILFEPREVLVTGGSMFPQATVVEFAGSKASGSGFQGGWILVGSHMEMWLGSSRITSSLVKSVFIESVPAAESDDRDPSARSRHGSH